MSKAMTARAKRVTSRAKAAKQPPARAPWDMLARDVTVFVSALAQMGYNAEAIMAQSPLAGVDLSDPDKRVSCQDAGAVIGLAMRQRFTPNIAAEMARCIPLGAFPLLDYLVLSSNTVADAVHQLSRYMLLVGHPATLTVREGADEWRLEIEGPPFSIEFSAAVAVLHLRREADGQMEGIAIFLKHAPDAAEGFATIVGCPVTAGASWSGVAIPRAALELQLRHRDPILRSLLETQANASLQLTGSRSGVAQDVARVLASRLTRGPIDIAGVARILATTPRTLQRRLTTEGVSFQELFDEARRDTAARLLRASTLSIAEVAYLIGYSEPAPFHRAFKRWFDVTPQDFRRRPTGTPAPRQTNQ